MRALHVPFSYFPSPQGGTEVYVAALANELLRYGVSSVIAAPGERNETYEWEGIVVHRFKNTAGSELETQYGEGDAGGAVEFGNILDRVRPDLVHFHALTPGASVLAMREVKKRSLPLLFTYHTPTVSCVRGTLMKWGSTVCDGVMNARICSACAMHGKGLPKIASFVATAIHTGSLDWLGRRLGAGRAATALQIPALVRKRHAATRAALELADRVIAVCDWVRQVLRVNAVPTYKIAVCRQGLPAGAQPPAAPHFLEPYTSARPLRLAFFGRLDPTKGVQIVIEALLRKPTLSIHFDIYGVSQGAAGAMWREQLITMSGGDDRVRFREPVDSSEVLSAMRAYDVIVVPSVWLETGPLVVYEAFGAGVPVLGSNLGGIAELVVDDQSGRLLPPESVHDWENALAQLVSEPGRIAKWRHHLPRPRTMAVVAKEMADHYQQARVANSGRREI